MDTEAVQPIITLLIKEHLTMTVEGLLSGKTAVVTGSGAGIGRAAALLLAGQGARLCLVDYDVESAEETSRRISQQGGSAKVISCDISQADEVERGMKEAAAWGGRIDILFANAGIAGTIAPIEDMSMEEWDTTLRTNLRGTFATIKYAVPYMKEQGGSIIITSSMSGNRVFSQAGYAAYSTSKAGQVALMKMAALELAGYQIRVNAVCPGTIETDIGESLHEDEDVKDIEIKVEYPEGNIPLSHQPGRPEQVAEAVLFLASDLSSHVTGTAMVVDGGESLLRG